MDGTYLTMSQAAYATRVGQASLFDLDFETFRDEMNAALAGCVASDEHQQAMANIRSKKRSRP